MIELIVGIFEDLLSLFTKLYSLLGYILGGAFVISLVYVLVLRPLVKMFVDKGKRMYWVSVLIMLVWGMFLGPILVFMLYMEYKLTGLIFGIIMYLSITMPVYLYSRKFEQ